MKDNIEKIDQGLIAFEALKAKAQLHGTKCQAISVEDDDAFNVALQILGEANDILKFIEAKRKELKAPILDIGRQIDAKAKELTELLEPSIISGKNIVKEYTNKKEIERQKELDKLKQEQEEQIRKEQERLNKIKEYLHKMQADITEKTINCDTPEQCDKLYYSVSEKYPAAELFHELADLSIQLKESCLQAILERKSFIVMKMNAKKEDMENIISAEYALNETINMNAYSVIQDINSTDALPTSEIEEIIAKETELESAKPKNTRMVWKWEIADWTQVPDEWKQISVEVVDDYLRLNKPNLVNNCIIQGVRFYQDAVIVLK